MIIGTAAYMSPEQARGRPVDRRADLWAFGAVLYEMLTGRPAFPGETVSDTIVAILEREPDWGALPADVPPSVRTLIRRCLAKDRRQRHLGHLGRAVRPRRSRGCGADDRADRGATIAMAPHGDDLRARG